MMSLKSGFDVLRRFVEVVAGSGQFPLSLR